MDRWLSRAVAVVVIAFVAFIAYRSMPAREPIVLREDGGLDAGADAAGAGASAFALGTALDAGMMEGGTFLSDLPELNVAVDGGLMPDGTPIPVLSGSAPRLVHLGVVLVTYDGAQGAPPKSRDKKEARAIADRLVGDAKTDFHGAVQHGDNGSSDDVGRVPRGVLEPSTEYVIFSLAPGAVSDVIETPRGFWIAKRID